MMHLWPVLRLRARGGRFQKRERRRLVLRRLPIQHRRMLPLVRMQELGRLALRIR